MLQSMGVSELDMTERLSMHTLHVHEYFMLTSKHLWDGGTLAVLGGEHG